MLTEVALLLVQLSAAELPAAMLLGCALNVSAGFCAELVTLTTALD